MMPLTLKTQPISMLTVLLNILFTRGSSGSRGQQANSMLGMLGISDMFQDTISPFGGGIGMVHPFGVGHPASALLGGLGFGGPRPTRGGRGEMLASIMPRSRSGTYHPLSSARVDDFDEYQVCVFVGSLLGSCGLC